VTSRAGSCRIGARISTLARCPVGEFSRQAARRQGPARLQLRGGQQRPPIGMVLTRRRYPRASLNTLMIRETSN
jgi:hypothetical protein